MRRRRHSEPGGAASLPGGEAAYGRRQPCACTASLPVRIRRKCMADALLPTALGGAMRFGGKILRKASHRRPRQASRAKCGMCLHEAARGGQGFWNRQRDCRQPTWVGCGMGRQSITSRRQGGAWAQTTLCMHGKPSPQERAGICARGLTRKKRRIFRQECTVDALLPTALGGAMRFGGKILRKASHRRPRQASRAKCGMCLHEAARGGQGFWNRQRDCRQPTWVGCGMGRQSITSRRQGGAWAQTTLCMHGKPSRQERAGIFA